MIPVDLSRFIIVSDRDPTFPWTKLERLLKLPDIFNPQWEDGVSPDPEVAMPIPRPTPSQFVWLVMEEEKAWGFFLNAVRGKYWVDVHLGFRKGLPGVVKKAAGLVVMHRLFGELGMRKISAFVPEFNMPARILARGMGLREEGFVPECVWRNGRAYGSVLYGITRNECIVWTERFRPKCTNSLAEQFEWPTAADGECTH